MSLPPDLARRALWRATLAYVLGWTAHTTFLFYLAPLALRLGGVEGRDIWIFSGTAVASLLTVIPAGHLADRYPRRRILHAGLVFLGLAYLPLILAPPGFGPTLLATFFTGTGLAALLVAFNSYVADLLAGPEMSAAYGRTGAFAVLAGALGPFLAAGIFGLVGNELTALRANAWLFLGGSAVGVALTLRLPTVRALPTGASPKERAAPAPMRARLPAAAPISILYTLVGFGYGMTNPYFAVFFLDHLRLPSPTWGVLLGIGTLAMAAGSLGAGVLVRRVSPRALILAPQVALALVSLLFLFPLTHVLLGLAYVARNLFSNTVAPMVATLLMGSTQAEARGRAQAWSSFGWNLGWALGALAGGVLLARIAGGVFVAGALVALAGTVVGLLLLRQR